MKKTTFIALSLLVSVNVSATEQTVMLEVPTMNCITCPITVEKALEKVAGVSEAEVTYDTKLAVVQYDDEQTTVSTLTQATKNAGYPSHLKKED